METPITEQDLIEFKEVYSPTALLGVFANAIKTNADNKIIIIKGIFQYSQIEKEYNGYYYDGIKSIYDNKSIRTKTPGLLRSKLENKATYIFKGFIEKKNKLFLNRIIVCGRRSA